MNPEQKKSFRPIMLFLGFFSVIAMLQAFLLYQSLLESQKYAPLYKEIMNECPCWCPPANNMQMPDDNFSCIAHFSPNDSVVHAPEFSVLKYNSDLCYGGRYNGSSDE